MILTSAMIILAQAAAPAPATQSGDWIGMLTLPSRATLRIAVHFRVDRDGILRGSFDSLDQRSWNTPLGAITMTPTTLTFTVPSNGSRYTAHWNAMTQRWVGVWSQGGAQLPLSLAAGGPPPRSAVSGDAWTLPSDAEIGDILCR